MMILAEVSSGRSDLASASPAKVETPGSPAAATGSIGARAALARRLERGGAHGGDDLGVGRFDRLDRVAGVDRPLEGLGADDLGDVGDLHHVEQRRRARQHVLGERARGGEDRVVVGRQRDEQRGERLGEAVLRRGQRRRRARAPRRRAWPPRPPPRATFAPATRMSTGAPSCERRGERARRQVAQAAVRDFGQEKGRHLRSLPLRRAAWRRAPPPS